MSPHGGGRYAMEQIAAGGGGGFDPTDWAGLAAFYDASDTATITASSGSVSQINNKANPGTYDLTQGTGARQPLTGTRTHNGLNVLDFDGGDQLEEVLRVRNQPQSVLIVGKADSMAGANRGLLGGKVASYNYVAAANYFYPRWEIQGSAATTPLPDTNPFIFFSVHKNAANMLWINGVQATGLGSPGVDRADGIVLGGTYTGNAGTWDGWIGTAVFWDADHSADAVAITTAANAQWAAY